MTSRVWLADGTTSIIPMMNFHPEGIGLEEMQAGLARHLRLPTRRDPQQRRYQHYYGDFLLDDEDAGSMEWPRFLGPACILVSPRYVGHAAAPRLLDPAIDPGAKRTSR